MASPTDFMDRPDDTYGYTSPTDPVVKLDPTTVTGTQPPPDPTTGDPSIALPGGTTGGTPTDFMTYLTKLIPGLGGNAGFGNINPNMIPLIASAYNDYKNSGQYMDLATKYADQMNPFGSQRAQYQQQLASLEKDPNAYLKNSPDYQAALQQGLGALDSSMSAKGFGGSGHAADSAQAFGSQLAAQYLNQDRQSLMTMAGANIGPGAAAGLLQTGITSSIDAKNNALSNLTRAFSTPTTNPPPGSTTPGTVDDINNLVKTLTGAGYTAAGASSMVKALQAAGYSTDAIKKIFASGGVDKVTPPTDGGGKTVTGDDGKTYQQDENGYWVEVSPATAGGGMGPPAPDVVSPPPSDISLPTDTTIYNPDDYSWLMGQ